MVEGARGGGADLLGLLAGEAGQDAQPVHVGVLALAGAHAVGGEALEQLDVVEALLHGVAEILELQVFVEIDEVLAGRVIDDGPGVAGALHFGRQGFADGLAEAGRRGGVAAGAGAVGHAPGQLMHAIDAATGEHALGQHVGDELFDLLVVAHARAGLVQQVGGGRPADAHENAVAGDVAGRDAGVPLAAGGDAGAGAQALAVGQAFDDAVAAEDLDAGLLQQAGQGRRCRPSARRSTTAATATPWASRSRAAR
jgi:hypothetical protein